MAVRSLTSCRCCCGYKCSCQAAKKHLGEIKTRYEGGLTAAEAAPLKERVERLAAERNGLRRERKRHIDLCEHATSQAKQLLGVREAQNDEMEALKRRVLELESASDDGLIIGKLQRQLTTTKTSYKAFARKYDMALVRARRKEGACRSLEEQMDSREKMYHALIEEKRLQVEALKDALCELTGRLLYGDAAIKAKKLVDETGKAPSDLTNLMKEANTLNLEQIKKQIDALSEVNRENDVKLRETESKLSDAELKAQGLETELATQTELVQDLTKITQQSARANDIARRVMALTEEVRTHKLTLLQAKRTISSLREEKRHYEQIAAQR